MTVRTIIPVVALLLTAPAWAALPVQATEPETDTAQASQEGAEAPIIQCVRTMPRWWCVGTFTPCRDGPGTEVVVWEDDDPDTDFAEPSAIVLLAHCLPAPPR